MIAASNDCPPEVAALGQHCWYGYWRPFHFLKLTSLLHLRMSNFELFYQIARATASAACIQSAPVQNDALEEQDALRENSNIFTFIRYMCSDINFIDWFPTNLKYQFYWDMYVFTNRSELYIENTQHEGCLYILEVQVHFLSLIRMILHLCLPLV